MNLEFISTIFFIVLLENRQTDAGIYFFSQIERCDKFAFKIKTIIFFISPRNTIHRSEVILTKICMMKISRQQEHDKHFS